VWFEYDKTGAVTLPRMTFSIMDLFRPGKPNLRGMLSTVDLLVVTCSCQVLFVLQTISTVLKTSYLNEEVDCTQPFPSVSVSCLDNQQI